jgi:uncharacterized membrane protein YjjP (DUF1212 family)
VTAPTEPSEQAGIEFILALARALHRYGTPADRLEEALSRLGRKIGVEAQFFCTPTSILVSFGDPAELRTAMLRVDGGELDMGKLAALDALADAVARKPVEVADGARRVEQIVGARPTWRSLPTLLAHGVSTAGAVVFFQGGPLDVAVAGALGLLIGLLSLVMQRSTAQTRVFEVVGAFLAAFVGGIAAAEIRGVSSSVVTIAGLLVLLPGLTLTVAMNELATRNLISGTARLLAALIVLLELGIGVAIGEKAAQALVHIPAAVPDRLPAWSEWAAVVASALAMVVVVRARVRAAPWIAVASLVGFAGTRAGVRLLDNPQLGVMVGAFALGVLVNVYARVLDRPAQVVLVPATLILVPGSLGFRGISSLLHRNTLSGIETTFGMFVVAMAIVAGLLVANATVPPRRVL